MHIMKGASGLGLRIVGGKGSKYGDMGVFVRDLEEGGAAHKYVRPRSLDSFRLHLKQNYVCTDLCMLITSSQHCTTVVLPWLHHSIVLVLPW